MRKIIYIISITLFVVIPMSGQDALQTLLINIENNNKQLRALQEMSSAEKLDNKVSNNLANPEVEVVYTPHMNTNPTEATVEATQSFDFPTAYKHRGQMIDIQNKQLDLAYHVKRKEILQEARVLVMEYIYQSKLRQLMKERVEYAQELYKGFQDLFERGDINILERNKTKLNLLDAQKNIELCNVQLDASLAELVRLNGGEPVSILPSQYSNYTVPLSFEDWFARIKYNNPMLQIAEQNIDMSKKQEQLARSLNLPKLRAGYSGDLIRGESKHGVLVAVSIPLWEGRNTVKSKKVQTIAMQYEKEDAEHQYKNELKMNFEKAGKLHSLLKEYSEIMDNNNNYLLLKKSFNMGQLSLIEYLQEILIYHTAMDDYLSTEKEYFLVLSELEQWEN